MYIQYMYTQFFSDDPTWGLYISVVDNKHGRVVGVGAGTRGESGTPTPVGLGKGTLKSLWIDLVLVVLDLGPIS